MPFCGVVAAMNISGTKNINCTKLLSVYSKQP